MKSRIWKEIVTKMSLCPSASIYLYWLGGRGLSKYSISLSLSFLLSSFNREKICFQLVIFSSVHRPTAILLTLVTSKSST